MEWNVVAMAVLGSAMCCLGFLRRPQGTLELISARFVIPLMVASATFLQVFWHAWQDNAVDIYQLCRVAAGFDAVSFIVLCMACFWIGYALPFGRWAPHVLLPLSVPVTPGRGLRAAAHALSCLALLIFVLDGLIPEVMSLIPGLSAFTIVVTFIAAVLLGLSLPEKQNRTVLDLPFLVMWIVILSLPYMATFSRGVGIPVVATAAAYSVRRGKLNWLGIGTALVLSIVGVQMAFSGRGTVGHYAGAIAWAEYLLSGAFWSDWSSAIASAMSANDSFTTLCVSMRASATTNIFALTPIDWLIFQIPLPHIFSFSPVFTLDLPQFLGGSGSWNYTPGIFGDVFIHLGWPGACIFLIVGAVYRATDELAFRPVPAGTFNPFFLLSVFGYVAMALGLFNNFRSWNTASFDGFCFVIVLLFVRKVLVPSDTPHEDDSHAVHAPYAEYGGEA